MTARHHLLVLALISVCATPLVSQTRTLGADLDGSQEVPASGSAATGWALVDSDDATRMVRVFVDTEGITATAAHVHIAPMGANGPVAIPLSAGPNGSWTGSGTLAPADYAAFISNGAYVNVHSAAFPGGEIRGQIGDTETEYFWAELDGAQEVPSSGSAATGRALLALHPVANVLSYEVTSSGLTNVVAAHVHRAPTGVNGPVLHGLIGSAGQYRNVTDKWTPGDLAALRAGDTYLNIHTSAFPGGEIRGQIVPFPARALCALLDGSQEVPASGSAARGSAVVELRPNGMIEYHVEVTGVAGVAAHIHTAPPGVNGGVTVPLSGGPTVWSGSAAVAPADLGNGLAGNWYVNVHSAAFPGGEIRGQLAIAASPRTFGRGCVASNGRRPELGADGPLALGAAQRFTARGAVGGSPGVLLIGFSSFPQPADLALLGFSGCFLHGVPAVDVPLAFDAAGFAGFTLAVPGTDFGAVGVPLRFDTAIVDAGPALVTTNALRLRVHSKRP